MLLNSKPRLRQVIRPLNAILYRRYTAMETPKTMEVKNMKIPPEPATVMDMPVEEPIKRKRIRIIEKIVKTPSERPAILDVPIEEPINAHILTNQIGSTHHHWSNALEKYPKLSKIKRKDILNSCKALKKLNFDVESILSKPLILYQNALTIQNRYEVLTECGFDPITLMLLTKYVRVMNNTVTKLKSFGYIPFETNMLENLCKCFTDVELYAKRFGELNDDMLIRQLREYVLNAYLRQRLNMNDDEIKKLWTVYTRIRHRSFKSVEAVIQLLLGELQFPKERIIKNAYLLYADVDNIRRIIQEIPSINGQDIRDIVYRRPKIVMSSCDGLLKSLEYIKAYGINESAITRCLEILTLGPDTILDRLKDLLAIEEFKVLSTNPRILRLVHYQNKARIRLEYLNHLKVRCASLHILSGASEKFAKFAHDGTDRTKGRDVLVFLENVLEKDQLHLRSLLSRHPNWCHIPVLQVKQCLEFLRSKNFTLACIYNNIYVLLYPIERIEEKLRQLYEPEYQEDLQLPIDSIYKLKKSEILTLILYLIECEYHFTGDGIWTQQQIHSVENFNNLLPDFPESINKVYKYGVKPSVSSNSKVKKPFAFTVQN
ncbi:transcription termination factor 5, mitochondrial [Eurosta solidaginis]|uniref:transcription termination factor 5, mitochondrial n=1 Tax=Eurosta solidaginis TaxID=178769 RepID=UPI003530C8EA